MEDSIANDRKKHSFCAGSSSGNVDGAGDRK